MEPPVTYEYDPRKLPQEALAAMGLSVACAAQTEKVVEMAIGGCLGVNAIYSTAISTHMPMPLRFHVLKAAAEIKIEDLDDLDLLDEILDKIDKAMQKRNDVAHDTWCQILKTGQLFTHKTTARGSIAAELIPMDIPTIKKDSAAIYAAGMELMGFLISKNLLPPFPPDPVPRGHKTKAARKKRRESLGKK
jgi:hypothetical protein